MGIMPLSEIILKKVKLELTGAIDPIMIQDLKISHTADIVSDQIIQKIHYSLAGQEGREIKFPKDWWKRLRKDGSLSGSGEGIQWYIGFIKELPSIRIMYCRKWRISVM